MGIGSPVFSIEVWICRLVALGFKEEAVEVVAVVGEAAGEVGMNVLSCEFSIALVFLSCFQCTRKPLPLYYFPPQIFFICACSLTLSGTISFLSVVIFHPFKPSGWPRACNVFCSTRLYALPSCLSKLNGLFSATGGLVMNRASVLKEVSKPHSDSHKVLVISLPLK